jgi:hypothetical protein
MGFMGKESGDISCIEADYIRIISTLKTIKFILFFTLANSTLQFIF